MITKVIKFEYIGAFLGILSSVLLIRILGASYKASLVELMAANAIYMSIGLLGISVLIQRDFYKMGKSVIILSTILPTLICCMDGLYDIFHFRDRFPLMLNIIFIVTFCLSSLLAVAYVSIQKYFAYFIIISSPAAVILILVVFENILNLTLTNFLYTYALINLFIVSFLFACFDHPFVKKYRYNDLIASSIKFMPYNLLQALPINALYLYFLNDDKDIAIFSVIISVSQFINKVPRLFFQFNLSKIASLSKDFTVVKSINKLLIIIAFIASVILIAPMYNFQRTEYVFPLFLALISNLYLPIIVKFDSDKLKENLYLKVYAHRSSCLLIILFGFLIYNLLDNKIILCGSVLLLIRIFSYLLIKWDGKK